MWFKYVNISPGTTGRRSEDEVNKSWETAITTACSANKLPDTLKELTVSAPTTNQLQLQAFIDAHRFQDTLLNLSISICKEKVGIPEILTLLTATSHIEKLSGYNNALSQFYATDVFGFISMPPKERTNRIEYIFESPTVTNQEIFLQPNILTNPFINGLSSIFISLKLDSSDIDILSSRQSATNFRQLTQLYGRYWRKFLNKDSVANTGIYLTGSFYLNQEYVNKANPNMEDGMFKHMLSEELDTTGATFLNQLVYLMATKTDSGLSKAECSKYHDATKTLVWLDLISDLFIEYRKIGATAWSYKTFIRFFKKAPCKKSNIEEERERKSKFLPNDTADIIIPDTETTITQLLNQMDREFLSFMLHFLTVLRQNEKLYHDSLPEGERAAFIAKFGPPIANMNEA